MQGALLVTLLNLYNNSMKKYSFFHFTNDRTKVQLGHLRIAYYATDVSIHSSASPG